MKINDSKEQAIFDSHALPPKSHQNPPKLSVWNRFKLPSKNLIATAFYGLLSIALLVSCFYGCGSEKVKTEYVDSAACYSVEIVNTTGEHYLIPISEIETMTPMSNDTWFIWKKDNTGWYGVTVIGYGKTC